MGQTQCCESQASEHLETAVQDGKTVTPGLHGKGLALSVECQQVRVDAAGWVIFEATIERDSAKPLGIDVEQKEEKKWLNVVELRPGQILDYNQGCPHPEHRIMVGDRILKINGIGGTNGSAKMMVEQAKTAPRLHLEVTRPPADANLPQLPKSAA